MGAAGVCMFESRLLDQRTFCVWRCDGGDALPCAQLADMTWSFYSAVHTSDKPNTCLRVPCDALAGEVVAFVLSPNRHPRYIRSCMGCCSYAHGSSWVTTRERLFFVVCASCPTRAHRFWA